MVIVCALLEGERELKQSLIQGLFQSVDERSPNRF